MASNYTSNYSLCQWEASDQVLRTEFNADNAKIDAALADKASVSALDALRKTVDGKASATALNSLKTTVSGHGTELAVRNCAVRLQTYTGDGTEDPAFTFDSKPFAVIFFQEFFHGIMGVRGCRQPYLIGGKSSDLYCTFSWSGNSVTVRDGHNLINQKGIYHTILALLEV